MSDPDVITELDMTDEIALAVTWKNCANCNEPDRAINMVYQEFDDVFMCWQCDRQFAEEWYGRHRFGDSWGC